jgi:hypothetical protein
VGIARLIISINVIVKNNDAVLYRALMLNNALVQVKKHKKPGIIQLS